MTLPNSRPGPQTTAIHAGEAPDATGASAPPIHMSSTFVATEPLGFSAHDLTADSPFVYARWGNPTVDMLERKIAAMEGVEACLCLASGMAAASAIFLTVLSAGDHVIVSDISYAGVAELARNTLPRFGISVSLVDLSDPAALSAAMRPNTRLVHCESPVNPIGRLTDLAAVAAIAHAGGALVSCDNTFASPVGQQPAALGVDLIMHSATKYICGHGDALGGAVAGPAELIARLRIEAGIHHGGVMSPFNAWLIARGAATLPLRMAAHARGATEVANWLETRDKVTRVIYPGLPSHPQYALAQRQMANPSAMIAFQVGPAAQGEALAQALIDRCQIVHYAVSLGHQRTLIYWLGTDGMLGGAFQGTAASAQGYRDWAGDGIFRLSVGLEDAADIIADLGRVL
jgi:methionine-gamma-lyase